MPITEIIDELISKYSIDKWRIAKIVCSFSCNRVIEGLIQKITGESTVDCEILARENIRYVERMIRKYDLPNYRLFTHNRNSIISLIALWPALMSREFYESATYTLRFQMIAYEHSFNYPIALIKNDRETISECLARFRSMKDELEIKINDFLNSHGSEIQEFEIETLRIIIPNLNSIESDGEIYLDIESEIE